MKLIVSACLVGCKVRYNGSNTLCPHEGLQKLVDAQEVIAFCPEIAGGLPTPRSPAEIQGKKDGLSVLTHKAHVLSIDGQDVTDCFIAGAHQALTLAKEHRIKIAILKARSPSCGSTFIYDGTFSKTMIRGMGVIAALLESNGIKVFDEDHIDEAIDSLVSESDP